MSSTTGMRGHLDRTRPAHIGSKPFSCAMVWSPASASAKAKAPTLLGLSRTPRPATKPGRHRRLASRHSLQPQGCSCERSFPERRVWREPDRGRRRKMAGVGLGAAPGKQRGGRSQNVPEPWRIREGDVRGRCFRADRLFQDASASLASWKRRSARKHRPRTSPPSCTNSPRLWHIL